MASETNEHSLKFQRKRKKKKEPNKTYDTKSEKNLSELQPVLREDICGAPLQASGDRAKGLPRPRGGGPHRLHVPRRGEGGPRGAARADEGRGESAGAWTGVVGAEAHVTARDADRGPPAGRALDARGGQARDARGGRQRVREHGSPVHS